MVIDRLQFQDCPAVAILHLTCLHTPFSGRAGQELLTRYYQAVAREIGACGYTAKQDGHLLGFVCGVWQPRLLRNHLLRSEWAALSWWAIWQVMAKPTLLLNLLKRGLKPDAEESMPLDGYELRPIVVSPEARGRGVARLLVETLWDDANRRGFSRVFLYTEENNISAQALYQKTGFSLIGKQIRGGATYLYYERS